MNVLASSFAVSLAVFAPAQAGVRLAKVPELVRLPAAAGSNLVLEVEVDAAATEVWLATDLAARDRVGLTGVGDKRWQLNLADARVAPLLPAGRDGGELFVFATIGGATRQSPPIAWSRATSGDGDVHCLLRLKDGTTVGVRPERTTWLDITKLERLELQGAASRQSAVVARGRELELPLLRRPQSDVWVLAGDKTLRERLQDSDTLEVEARLGAASALFRFALVPRRLDLPDPRADFVLVQRRSAKVPGSHGWLTVHIDDITMGGTLLHVTSDDGQGVIAQQEMHERDFVEFALADDRYVLVVDKLVNLLVGDDHAELHVQRAEGFRPDPIGLLLRCIGASGDTFVREGQEVDGATAKQFLLAKLGSHRGPPVTLDDFIDSLASTSGKTGKPYEVRRRDGTTVTMQQWLRAELAKLPPPPAPAKK